jgi:SseB protein N-terminal domain
VAVPRLYYPWVAGLRGDEGRTRLVATGADGAGATCGGGAGRDPGKPGERVDRALDAAVADPGRIGDVLSALIGSRVWVPVPGPAAITATAGVTLPVLTYLRRDFVPAFTSHRRLVQAASMPGPPAGPLPHLVVSIADLAAALPADVGIALNPGAGPSVAVSPAGLAGLRTPAGGQPGSPGPEPVPARTGQAARAQAETWGLLAGACLAFAAIPAVRDATAGWLSGTGSSPVLLIAVRLADPADAEAQHAVQAALANPVARPGGCGQVAAAGRVAPGPRIGVEVIFPGAHHPDLVESWTVAAGTRFYAR